MQSTALGSLLESLAEKLILLDTKFAGYKKDSPGFDYVGGFEAVALRIRKQAATISETFTICVIGEFKVGKSTLLNSLLGLHGDAALAAADSLDTACSIMIKKRRTDDPEARLLFDEKSRLPARAVTWAEAKRYTSQVERDRDERLARESPALMQVEYYVDAPELEHVQLNDLPGTGSIYWQDHTATAEESLQTADAIMWVIFDQAPGADGTRFLDIIARQGRRVIPVINVRQEAEEMPDSGIADEVAKEVQRFYRQHFEVGITHPLFYSARIAELERARPEPSLNVLREAGYPALVEHIFGPEAAERRNDAKEARIYGACRDLVKDGARESALQLEILAKWRKQASASCEGFAGRIDELDQIHEHVEAQLRLLGESYAVEICTSLAALCGRFIDENLKITNWEAIKTFVTKSLQELTDMFEAAFKNGYLREDPRLPACEVRAMESAGRVLRKDWRCKEWNGKITQPSMPSKTMGVAQGSDLENAIGRGLLGAVASAILMGLVWVFPPFLLVAYPLSTMSTRNPMAQMRDEVKQRTYRELYRWQINLEDAFVSRWASESQRIEAEIRKSLGANQNASTQELDRLTGLTRTLEDTIDSLDSAARNLYAKQTGRGGEA